MPTARSLGTIQIAAAILATALIPGCERSDHSSSSPPRPKAQETIEACTLLTKEEVGEVQSTTISEVKSSIGYDGSYLVSQCYYAATGPNLSVSFTVTQADPANAKPPGVRQYWKQNFGKFEKGEANSEKEREKKSERSSGREEEEASPPEKVEGIGDEAFWAGTRVGGALFVLKGDIFLRISVGGPDANEKKLVKSKALAAKALTRL